MTNDCGHEIQHEESRLVCSVCETEEQQRTQDKAWNAAIEAAANEVAGFGVGTDDEVLLKTAITSAVIALKREAK